jgi:rhodanese-related sulfurtransferase
MQRGPRADGFAGALALITALALPLLTPPARAEPPTLQSVEQDVSRRHGSIAHLTPAEALRLVQGGNVLLLDVREPAEYVVSRLPGAIRVDPGISRAAFMAQHGAALQGRTLLLYCAVGVRSSRLAERVREDALKAGASGIANLKGGIFAWHNEGRPLADGAGRTDHVHPYDRNWGKLLSRPGQSRIEPRN